LTAGSTVSSQPGTTAYSIGASTTAGQEQTDVSGTAKAQETTTKKETLPATVREIRLSAAEKTLEPSQQFSLKAEVLPKEAANPGLSYRSDDPKVATVSENGKVTAVGAGTAIIRCTAKNGVLAQCKVRVMIPLKQVSLSVDKPRYAVGDTVPLRIQLSPENATDPSYSITTSSAIAGVSENQLQCKAGGSLTVTLTTKNGLKASCTVNIIDPEAFSAEVVRLTNEERAKEGLSALTAANKDLKQAALLRAHESAELFSHTRPDGRDCFTAFLECGIRNVSMGENLAMGYTTPAAVVADWMNSPGHRANMLDSDFTQIAIGVVLDDNGKVFWAMNLIS